MSVSAIIFSSSLFLPFKFASFVDTAFFATSSCLPFSAISSVASLMCFSASFTSKVCISISLLIASNSRLFFTLSLCFSYFFIRSPDSFIVFFFCSMNCCIPFISSSIRFWRACKPSISSSRSLTSIGNSPFKTCRLSSLLSTF